MQTVAGNLITMALQGEFDVIVHGCNCFHTMGAGIAKPISETFPEALMADRQTPKGTREKLEEISTARVSRDGLTLTVVNAYTQFHYAGQGRKVDYPAIGACFDKVAAHFPDQRIGYPQIGAGLAGGDWEEIAPRIDRSLAGCDHTLVVFAS